MKIAIDQIVVLNPSQNIDADTIQGMAESIGELGLSHPIILRRDLVDDEFGNGSPTEQLILVSGEKRLLAAKRLGWTEIEAEIRVVDATRAKEIRIHENLKRFNLPWPEQVILVSELHALRQAEHGTPVRTGRPPKEGEPKPKVGWSLRDTAEELQLGVGNLSEDLALARALSRDPMLAKVTDKKTATKLIKNAARRNQAELESGLPGKMEANEVYLGDSTEVLQQLADGCIDHCITDPPWIKFFQEDLRIDQRTLPVFKELFRVLKNNSFLYLICGLDDYAYYTGVSRPNPTDPRETIHDLGELEKIGFTISNTPIIWRKLNSLSRRGVRAWEYDRDFEFIIVAAKGSPALTTARRLSGIKDYPIVPPMKMVHANEKPVALIEDIVTDCSYQNDIIIDPFAGSGVLASACKNTGRKYIVIERDPEAHAKIVKRLEK